MRLNSFLKRFFGGEVIERYHSPINGEILVVKELSGKISMRVGGVTQSGGMVEEIWQKIVIDTQGPTSFVKNVLILGLGGGTLAKLAAERWPGAKITGVEIDPKVIEIGKKYFGLDKILGIKIVIDDAIGFTRSLKSGSGRYDLIFVDLYLGQSLPKKTEDKDFLNSLRKVLTKDGLIIFNRLYFGKHKKETDDFVGKLKKIFPKITSQKTEFNLFIFTVG